MSSKITGNIDFQNDEFIIVDGGKNIYIQNSKHLGSDEEARNKYRAAKKLLMDCYNNIDNRPYLKAHGINREYLIKLIKNGTSLSMIAAIVYQFVMQKQYEEQQEAPVAQETENEIVKKNSKR